MENEDEHPYVLSQLVKKEDLDWSKTQLGLCDFRSDGTEWVYFLTPFAKKYYKNTSKGS